MEEVVIATPIHYSASTMPHDFGNGITIQELKPILWDRAVHKASFSPKELGMSLGGRCQRFKSSALVVPKMSFFDSINFLKATIKSNIAARMR
jgi:hypothetical protein